MNKALTYACVVAVASGLLLLLFHNKDIEQRDVVGLSSPPHDESTDTAPELDSLQNVAQERTIDLLSTPAGDTAPYERHGAQEGTSYNSSFSMRTRVEFEGKPFDQLDLETLELEELTELRKIIGVHQGELLKEIKSLPIEKLVTYDGAEFDELQLRWASVYFTHYIGGGEARILEIDQARFPQIYEMAAMVQELRNTSAYGAVIESWRSDCEKKIRKQFPDENVVFVPSFDGGSVYAYAEGDVGGKMLSMFSRYLHQ